MIDEAKIEAALCAKLCTTQLTEEEVKIWSDRFAEKMTKSTPEEEAFFAERRRKAVSGALFTRAWRNSMAAVR